MFAHLKASWRTLLRSTCAKASFRRTWSWAANGPAVDRTQASRIWTLISKITTITQVSKLFNFKAEFRPLYHLSRVRIVTPINSQRLSDWSQMEQMRLTKRMVHLKSCSNRIKTRFWLIKTQQCTKLTILFLAHWQGVRICQRTSIRAKCYHFRTRWSL